MQLYAGIIVIASLCSLATASLFVSIDSNSGTLGNSTIARLNEQVNFTVRARVLFPYKDSYQDLKFEVDFPFNSSISGICEGFLTLIDLNCVPVLQLKVHSIVADFNGTDVTRMVYWRFNRGNQRATFSIRLSSFLGYNDSYITLNFTASVLEHSQNIGHTYNLLFLQYNNQLPVSAPKNASIRIVGPALSVSSDMGNSYVDVGTYHSAIFKLEHLPTSMENVSDVNITIKSSADVGIDAYVFNNNTNHSLPFTMNVSTLAVGESIDIHINFFVANQAKIGQPLDLKFEIECEGTFNSTEYEYEIHARAAIVRDIQGLTTTMTLPSVLSPVTSVPVTVSFNIPKGVLPSLTFVLECESSELNPIPGTLFYSRISLGNYLTTKSRDLDYTSNDGRRYDVRALRRKRSTLVSSGRTIHYRPYVTITHPVTSPASYSTVTMHNAIGVIPTSRMPYRGSMTMKIAVSYGKRYRVLRSASVTVSRPFAQLTKNYIYTRDEGGYPIFLVEIDLVNFSNSSGSLVGYIWDEIMGIGVSSISYTANNIVNGTRNNGNHLRVDFNLPVGQVLQVRYLAEIIDIGSFALGNNTRKVTAYYSLNGTSLSYKYPEYVATCVYRKDGQRVVYYALYGYIVLLLFVGILVGYLILLLISFLYMKVVNKDVNPFDYDDVGNNEDRMAMLETQNRLLMDEAATRNDFNTIKNLSTVDNGASIISTLVNKNRHQVYRDLDSLDILNSIFIDQNLEDEYEKLSVGSLILLIQNLAKHSNMKAETMDKAVQKFERNVQTLEKEVQTMQKKEANKIMKELSKKNKREMQQLLSKQKKEREAMESDLEGESDATQKEILLILTKQHKAERDDVVHKLKLQQDEESEKLRKRYSLQKRAMLRDMQRTLIDEIIEKNGLNQAQADWLISEHRRVDAHLNQRYNLELAKQRMLLEERLERRRALAKKKELEEENQTEMLNTLASQQVNIVKRLRREEDITPEQADEYMAKIREDMTRAKEALDKEKEVQEKMLSDRLNSRKRKQLEVNDVNNRLAESQLQKEMKEASTHAMLDPTAYIDAVMDLRAKQREDGTKAENDIDEEDTKELIDQYQYSVAQTEANIRLTKDQLLQQLRHDGVSEDDLSKICQQHNRELRQLQESHDEERQIQEQNFENRLRARRREIENNLCQEQQEQEDLRRRENTMVQSLLLNQVSISDEERDRILQEHERNMVQVENSLTLSRLRQKRMLEEALAERKAKQMDKLQQKQNAEASKKLQFANDSEDEDERSHNDLIEMMKRHGEQRLELLHGDDMDIDDEVENVRTKMMEERANALKEQEERIAAMLSTLQMEKAKELGQIEEQQKAINNLKMNLLDDLNERGVLSDNKCQQIINRHQEEQTRLVQRLDNQRDEQEQMLRDRLRKRMEVKQKQMNSDQKRQLEESVQQLPLKQRAQAQIRKALLLHKQMLDTEQFKTRMTKECNQTLEDAKRQFDVKKEKYLQDQELNFIAGLVQLGKFSKAELLAVLKILFPLKNSSEIEAVLNKIHSGKDAKLSSPKKDDMEETDPLAESTLIDRTKVSFLGIGSISRFKLRSSTKKQPKGNIMALNLGGDSSGLTPIDRPDPLGRDSPNVIPDIPSGRGGDLPPLEPSDSKRKKRKKKKKRAQTIDEEDDDEAAYLNVHA